MRGPFDGPRAAAGTIIGFMKTSGVAPPNFNVCDSPASSFQFTST